MRAPQTGLLWFLNVYIVLYNIMVFTWQRLLSRSLQDAEKCIRQVWFLLCRGSGLAACFNTISDTQLKVGWTLKKAPSFLSPRLMESEYFQMIIRSARYFDVSLSLTHTHTPPIFVFASHLFLENSAVALYHSDNIDIFRHLSGRVVIRMRHVWYDHHSSFIFLISAMQCLSWIWTGQHPCFLR